MWGVYVTYSRREGEEQYFNTKQEADQWLNNLLKDIMATGRPFIDALIREEKPNNNDPYKKMT